MSAYILYINSVRDTVKTEHPTATFAETARILAERWKSLSQEEMAQWKTQANELRAANPEYGKRKKKANKKDEEKPKSEEAVSKKKKPVVDAEANVAEEKPKKKKQKKDV